MSLSLDSKPKPLSSTPLAYLYIVAIMDAAGPYTSEDLIVPFQMVVVRDIRSNMYEMYLKCGATKRKHKWWKMDQDTSVARGRRTPLWGENVQPVLERWHEVVSFESTEHTTVANACNVFPNVFSLPQDFYNPRISVESIESLWWVCAVVNVMEKEGYIPEGSLESIPKATN
ncbi:hypothetical protein JR316_0012790 [Psilocybe cubensis]|uniref:Uncharacterized protein n=2 Tax=Psilocybe cubensis TaxID=181762 RepID=A0A8H7XTC0_PSICU|nr:hypothetical protein JR316_0012790 [Psilocybe cubensis]KAH9474332.1 hypothetical protein JR316_0012790 [Psilocybe cubensis]